jgi:hypothetical protein
MRAVFSQLQHLHTAAPWTSDPDNSWGYSCWPVPVGHTLDHPSLKHLWFHWVCFYWSSSVSDFRCWNHGWLLAEPRHTDNFSPRNQELYGHHTTSCSVSHYSHWLLWGQQGSKGPSGCVDWLHFIYLPERCSLQWLPYFMVEIRHLTKAVKQDRAVLAPPPPLSVGRVEPARTLIRNQHTH